MRQDGIGMRFTLTYRRGRTTMRMDAAPSDRVGDIMDAAMETWGCDGIVLRDGYDLLAPGTPARECISDGDLVEVLPDPFARRRCHEIGHASGVARGIPPWLAGWVRRPTLCSAPTR